MPLFASRSLFLAALTLQLSVISRCALALVPFQPLHAHARASFVQETRLRVAPAVWTSRTNNKHGALFMSSSKRSKIASTTKKVNGLIPEARRPPVEAGLRYSSNDWLRNIISLPKSFLLGRVRFHLATNTILCAFVAAAHRSGMKVSIPMLGHTLLGSFLGLLLVFRTNSAYARFWEARGIWTKVMSTCRGLAFEEVAYLRPHSPRSAARLATLLAAYPDALAHQCLSGTKQLPPHVEELVDPDSALKPAEALCLKMHVALAAAASESSTSGSNHLEALHLASMTHDVNSLAGTLASCEKIVQTPVPFSYSRHTSRFLTIWCGLLPFAIVEPLGLLSVPVMAIMCWLLFGIEEIGHLIEQPFVPVVAPGSAAAKDIGCERAAKTRPYDIGLPVCTLAGQVRAEVKKITASAEAPPSHDRMVTHSPSPSSLNSVPLPA